MVKTPRPWPQGKNVGTYEKVSSQGILLWNMRAQALTVQKLLAKLKFKKKGSIFQGQGHMVKQDVFVKHNDDIKIWQVNIIIWQVFAEVCHHRYQ